MRKEDCRVLMPVIFGRGRGQKTRGVVVKMNGKSAKVRTKEARGKRSVAGSEWSVAYSLLSPDPEASVEPDSPALPTATAIAYSPFSHVENLAMEGINLIYCSLSPENLTCDGELPRSQVQRRARELRTRLNGFFQVVGRSVDESTAMKWDEAKRKYEETQIEIASRTA